MIGALGYSIGQGALSLWRGRGASVLAVATITLALFVLGAVLLLALNVERLATAWRGSAELSVYLQDDVSPAQRTVITRLLAGSPLVAGSADVTKTEAQQRFIRLFPDLAHLATSGQDNPFPASIEVRLRPGRGADAAVQTLADRLRGTPGVSDVRYDRQWIDRLLNLAGIVDGIGFLLAAVLSIAGALSVAIVVRLALFARRAEVEIMRLVGAPLFYLRGPFVVEGLLHGGIGAALGLLVLLVGAGAVHGAYGPALQAAFGVSALWFLPAKLCALLVAGGMAVGSLGGLVACWSGR